MLLVIDAGNTNITLGIVARGRLRATRRVTTRSMTADELELLVGGLLGLDGIALEAIESIAVASVVPWATEGIRAVAAHRRLPVLVADAGTVPLAIRVDRPSEVGADRLVNALAGHRLHGTPAVVVDFGTATTFDAVARDGAYVGGAIAPGLELGLEALAARTAKLPRIALREPDHAIGRTTVDAMQAGTIIGYRGLVTGVVARIREELAAADGVAPESVKAILTGGLSAAPWIDGLEGVNIVDPDLTLKGLAILHAELRGGDPFDPGLVATGPGGRDLHDA